MTWAGEQKTLSCKKVESDWRQDSDKMKKHNLKVETVWCFLKNKGTLKRNYTCEIIPFNIYFKGFYHDFHRQCPRSLPLSLMWDMSRNRHLNILFSDMLKTITHNARCKHELWKWYMSFFADPNGSILYKFRRDNSIDMQLFVVRASNNSIHRNQSSSDWGS